ncbi:interleukin-17 receptor B [Aotus nancymaae]|uniref:interleukin-17 receptor B n=1 Tax=Aotus nancymaae TaxID=37293 RepID=UPI000625F124|nr:interleukin-17 receptor B [Aotus nancymaae]
MLQHDLTPGDLKDLRVETVKTSVPTGDYSILMNISWVLRADASIRLLKATKICVTGKSNFQSYSCVRCNYTEAFQTQTRPSGGKWTFSYIGFPVELNTVYFIGAHNIPNANMNEDGPSMSVNFTSPVFFRTLTVLSSGQASCRMSPSLGLSDVCLMTGPGIHTTEVPGPSYCIPSGVYGTQMTPGCLDHIMKYKKKCVKAGSLWAPNITACKKNETVEVNFTTSPLGNRYMALIQHSTVIGFSQVLEPYQNEQTRASVVIPVTGESEGAVVQLTPYFPTCGTDCIRHKGKVVLCPQTGVPFPLDNNRSNLGGWLPLLLPSLLVATWVLVAGIYLMWRHERIKKTSFSTTTLLPPIKVLVVYPSEICFHHTVCHFTEFLQNQCRSEVILEKWQKKKIAEMGPVQWLAAQKKAVDKVIFLLSNDVNSVCDATCDKSEGSPSENSQDLFPLAFNLFCSDLRSQTHLHKYVVVYFTETDTKDDYDALSVCPKYHLMKDTTAFCEELLHIKQQVSVGKRSQACHNGCCSL